MRNMRTRGTRMRRGTHEKSTGTYAVKCCGDAMNCCGDAMHSGGDAVHSNGDAVMGMPLWGCRAVGPLFKSEEDALTRSL